MENSQYVLQFLYIWIEIVCKKNICISVVAEMFFLIYFSKRDYGRPK